MNSGILLLGYDTEYVEDPEYSLRAVKAITEVHMKHSAPATFFIVGKLLEVKGEDFEKVLDKDLFDIQSHTYSHQILKDHKMVGKRPGLEVIDFEIKRAKELIKSTFGREAIGLRGPVGYYQGLQGQREVLEIIWKNGIRFVSTDGCGIYDTFPAPFNQPYWYENNGFPGILEIPSQGWHENVLKGYNQYTGIWPLDLPWLEKHPSEPPKTPEEEFAIHKRWLDYAIQNDLVFSPYEHPWSVYRFNPEARTIHLILSYAERNDMEIMTYLDLYEKLKSERRV